MAKKAMNIRPRIINWKFAIIIPIRTREMPDVSNNAAFRVHMSPHLRLLAPPHLDPFDNCHELFKTVITIFKDEFDENRVANHLLQFSSR